MCELPRLHVDEVLWRRPPQWPPQPAAVPEAPCCENCLRALLCHVWRCAGALQALLLDTPSYEAAEDATRDEGWQDAWPAALPPVLATAEDYLGAAQGVRALAAWCDRAAEAVEAQLAFAMSDPTFFRQLDAVFMALALCETDAACLADALAVRGTGQGPWCRAVCTAVGADVLERASMALYRWDF